MSKQEARRPYGKLYVDSLQTPGYYRFQGKPGESCPAGFGVRVTPAGKKMYFVERKMRGTRKSVRVSIDYHGAITFEQALKKAETISAELGQGHNPNAERREKQAAVEAEELKDQLTLRKILEDYCSINGSLKDSTKANYRKFIHRCLADWLDIPISEISKDLVQQRYQSLCNIQRSDDDYRPKRWNGIGQANSTMRILRALFNFARAQYEPGGEAVIKVNPVTRLKDTKSWKTLKERTTTLPIDKLDRWYISAVSLENPCMRDCLLLLLFTGLRAEEAMSLKWDDVTVDHEKQSGHFTVRDPKNKQDHQLPMTSFTFKLFDRMANTRKNEYVFPGVSASGHIVELRKSIAKITVETGMKFTPHDLRRTFATICEALGLPFTDIKKLLNHKSKDITERYMVARLARLKEHLQEVEQFILRDVPADVRAIIGNETNRRAG